MKRIAVFAALLTLLPLAAHAADEKLPFGFSDFHWGMSQQESSVHATALAPAIKTPIGMAITNQPGLFFGPYHWKDCIFNIGFSFGSKGLASIGLYQQGVSPTCLTVAQDELKTRFGAGRMSDFTVFARPNKGKKFGEHGDWGDDQTVVGYSSMYGNWADIILSQKGGEPMVIYDVIDVDRKAIEKNAP